MSLGRGERADILGQDCSGMTSSNKPAGGIGQVRGKAQGFDHLQQSKDEAAGEKVVVWCVMSWHKLENVRGRIDAPTTGAILSNPSPLDQKLVRRPRG